MNFIEELIEDEDFVVDTYKDPAGYETGGIGHKVKEKDLKVFKKNWSKKKKTAYWISQFIQDLSEAIRDVNSLISSFKVKPNKSVVEILVNMRFNLGLSGLKKFNKMITALSDGDYQKAADEMIDSKWHRDFVKWNKNKDDPGLRSRRLENKMRNAQ